MKKFILAALIFSGCAKGVALKVTSQPSVIFVRVQSIDSNADSTYSSVVSIKMN